MHLVTHRSMSMMRLCSMTYFKPQEGLCCACVHMQGRHHFTPQPCNSAGAHAQHEAPDQACGQAMTVRSLQEQHEQALRWREAPCSFQGGGKPAPPPRCMCPWHSSSWHLPRCAWLRPQEASDMPGLPWCPCRAGAPAALPVLACPCAQRFYRYKPEEHASGVCESCVSMLKLRLDFTLQ